MPVDSALLDIETLGTHADSVVLSVGIVAVDSTKDYTYDELIKNGFYKTLQVKPQVDAGRSIQKSTLDWWGTQGTDAMSVLKPSSDDIHHTKLIEDIIDYFDSMGVNKKTVKVYARGSHFDFSILHDLFRKTCGIDQDKMPWNFWNIHDSKTVIETLLDKRIDVKPEGFIHHNALHDAAREYMNIQIAIYEFQKTLDQR